MWNIVELWWWDVECITHFTLHHSTSNIDHLWHYSKPHHIPRHTIIPHHITPSPLAAHYSTLQYHWYRPHMHRTTSVSHCILFYITFHIKPHSMYSTPHFRSHHILATLCITPHFTQHSGTAFHLLHNRIIPPHLTVITPNSTSHYHVSHNWHSMPHRTVRHHHILHRTT